MIQIYRLLEAPTALTLQDAGISETSLNFCPDTRSYIPEDSVCTPFSLFLYKTSRIHKDAGKLFTPCFTFRTPRGLEDVSMYPELFAELLRSGHWTVGDLKKVAGLNLLRVFAKVEKVNSLCDINVLCVCVCVFGYCVCYGWRITLRN